MGAIASAEEFFARQQITPTDSLRAAISPIVVECEDTVKAFCTLAKFEPGTHTDRVLDAPWNSREIYLPLKPVRAVTSLYVNRDARGNSASFDSTHLKTAYTDYRLVIDMDPEGWSKTGTVQILTASFWGAGLDRPYSRLGFGVHDVEGAIKVTYTYGYTVPPPRAVSAIYKMVAMIAARRKTGLPVTSASLNGASYSTAGPFTASAALYSPDVLADLRGFYPPVVLGGAR